MDIVENGYAKINLTLEVTGKREDGYHNILSVMQSVSLCDTVHIKKSENISVLCDNALVPGGEKNIAYKAAKKFFEYAGENSGAEIYIEKRIPIEAGLAGGSADAAAVLRGLNKLFEAGLSLSQLCAIGAQCGADVPFCIMGGTYIAGGIGEKLSAVSPLTRCDIVIAKPKLNISTAAAYSRIDGIGFSSGGKGLLMKKFLEEKNLSLIGKNLYNDFERAEGAKAVGSIKETLIKNGALGALMSGSGSAVYGIFDNTEMAKKAFKTLSADYRESFICNPV